ncbi:hypothetical protein J1G42_12835 [Cellulomonas sp. zg-ZUI222]|uniref:P-loop NTPase n=1 Tax=Cellulomonas wangleii TaxID=2816956 RepID=UPI001A94A525|nr:hypothetical protein [Cellulomonas wangleii]MBO0921710.1 hypothetical protein [Cellulomonas wangleii]
MDHDPHNSSVDLKRAIASGRTILVIGDPGSAQRDQDSPRLQFSRELAKIAGIPDDSPSDLHIDELLQAATGRDSFGVNHALHDFKSTRTQLHSFSSQLLAGPWERIYNLSGINTLFDDAPSSAKSQVCFSDATDGYTLDHSRNQVINMVASQFEPNPHFRPPTGARTDARTAWFRQFGADIVSRPVLVLSPGGDADIWDWLREREQPSSPALELPSGFYAAPALSAASHYRCQMRALSPVEMSASDFMKQFCSSNLQHIADGRRSLARARKAVGAQQDVQLMSSLSRVHDEPSWDFLRGYDPRWPDIMSGRVVRLSRVREIRAQLSLDPGRRNVVIVQGRAGSGKTASLMRVAHELHQQNYSVAWVDRSASARLSTIIDELATLDVDAVIVDDIDMFGNSASDFCRRANRGGKTLVLAGIRTTKLWNVSTSSGFAAVDGDASLSDNDLRLLRDALEQAGLLGRLKALRPSSAQIEELRTISQRDLLGALIQVVTGVRFEERVLSERAQLDAEDQRLYDYICFASSRVYEAVHSAEEDLLQISSPRGELSHARLAIGRLVQKKLVLRETLGLRVRHRAIADVVSKSLNSAEVYSIVSSMLLFYASRAAHISDNSHPDRRHMIHLLSHTLLRDLRIDVGSVRRIYESVQQLLADDFHYWLQRGAFEVEVGDVDLADQYLEAARACEGGSTDYKVTTEWGFMCFVRVKQNPHSERDIARALHSFEELEKVARRDGTRSPHTFTILLTHGLDWLETRPSIGSRKIASLTSKLIEIRTLAEALCMDNADAARAVRNSGKRLEQILRGDEPPPSRYPIV